MSREIGHRQLRSAIEFAVLIAAEGHKRRPPLAFPKELKPFLSTPRVPTGALGALRRAIEADGVFRAAIAAVAVPELVDEVGRLWLAGRSGWEARAVELVEAEVEEAASHDLRRDLRRAEKRRTAAEQAAARVHVELLQRVREIEELRSDLDLVRAELEKADDAVAEVRAELIDTRNELRHARDREASAVRRAESAEATTSTSSGLPTGSAVGAGLSAVPSARAVTLDSNLPVDPVTLSALLASAQDLADRLASLQQPDAHEHQPRTGPRSGGGTRVPLALAGGVIASSSAAAAQLLSADATLIVDGYNVAKLVWPNRSLEQQRDELIARVEGLAASRQGIDATIVFDGASVVGAHAIGARRAVRVLFSAEGVTADDVIRDEVDRLPPERAVIVVTNDREIVRDVRQAGANVIPSNAFIAIL
jgi:predicted RNA-binding protein with PIN domain